MALNPSPQVPNLSRLANGNLASVPDSVGAAPDTITNLSRGTMTSSGTSLSWTLPANTGNVEIYQRDVTASGAFGLIATLGAASSYNVTGLTAENQYEWKAVASNANGDSADSNVVEGTTTAAGATSHGDTYIITGAGFGSKTDYNTGGYTIGGQTHLVARSSDFDNASTQEPASNTKTGWQNHLDGIYPILTSTDFNDEATLSKATLELSGGPGRSGKWLKRLNDQEVTDRYPTNSRLRNFNLWPTAVNHGQMYASVYIKVQQSYETGKTIRFYWNNDSTSGNNNIYMAKNGSATQVKLFADPDTSKQSFFSDNTNFPDNQWARHEFVVDFANGEFSHYVDGVASTDTSKGYNEVITSWIAAGATIDYFLLGNTIAQITAAGQFAGWALPYLDFSFKRVELTNSATWGSETKKVAQTPINDGTSGWTDTRIPIVINQGDFASLDGLYLHVVEGGPGAMTSIYSEAL